MVVFQEVVAVVAFQAVEVPQEEEEVPEVFKIKILK